MKAELTFVRHGISEANITGRWQGHGDSPLSPQGREQAAALASALSAGAFDRIISSDLQRAASTAAAIAEATGAPLKKDPAWREINVGAWEGLTRPEVAERFPDEIAALARGEVIAIGGAESWTDLEVRIRAAFDRLRDTLRDGERVAVVAHGGVIASLASSIFRIPRSPRRLGNVDNTSRTNIIVDGDALRMRRFNDTTHLKRTTAWAQGRQEKGDTLVRLRPVTGAAEVSIEAHLRQLHRCNAGAEVELEVPPASLHTTSHSLLRIDNLEPPTGPCDVVVGDDSLAFANYNLHH